MIKIGFNTLAWTAVVSDEQFPLLDRLKEIGYDGVECFVGASDNKAYKRFGDHARALGLETTAVSVVGKDENPVDPSPAVRQRGLDRIKWGIDRVHDMGAALFCGPLHSAHAFFPRHAPQDQEYGWAAEVLHSAGDHARDAGVTIVLEALNRFECYLCNTMAQLKRLVDETAHPHVRAMYDTHHANIEEKKIRDAIQTIAPVLVHVHISENDRGTPGDGHVPWSDNFSALAEIGYDGWMTIEAFSRNDPDFANAINVWREYNPPWDIATNGLAFIKAQCKEHGLPTR
jgi:D-psicose/D-tagatose/L-ribulose 3-epimerase